MLSSVALLSWVGAVFGFGFLILIHEFGHFWALKMLKLPVHAFSIGFGNALLTWKYRETEIRLGWIPLGGYVLTEDPDEVERREAAGEPLFPNQHPIAQFLVALMGPLANLALAFVLFLFVIAFWGEPRPVPTVETAIKGSPAFVAGLQAGDRLLALDQSPLNCWQDLIDRVQENGMKTARISINRDGRGILLPITPIREGERFVLGIRPRMEYIPPGAFSTALRVAVARTSTEFFGVIEALKRMFTFSGAGNVSGPIAILGFASDAARGGVMAFLTFMAMLSANLAVFNLLPIPPLDGLRIIVSMWQMLFGLPPKEKFLIPIYQWGAFGLAVLFLLVTLKDIGAFL